MKHPILIALAAMLALPAASSAARLSPDDPADCRATYADAAAWDDAIDRAARDIRHCTAADRIAPAIARRGLSALTDLRDLHAYDVRRAAGTRSRRRDGLYRQRLHAVMVRTLPAGVGTVTRPRSRPDTRAHRQRSGHEVPDRASTVI